MTVNSTMGKTSEAIGVLDPNRRDVVEHRTITHRCGHVRVHRLKGRERKRNHDADILQRSVCDSCIRHEKEMAIQRAAELRAAHQARLERERRLKATILNRLAEHEATAVEMEVASGSSKREIEAILATLFNADKIEYRLDQNLVRRYYIGAPPETKSKGDWGAVGFKPRPGETPYRIKTWRVYGGRSGEYHYYTADQVVPIKRRAAAKPAVEIDILAAVFAITRYAKRCRDAASACYNSGTHGFAGTWRKRKDEAYLLKDQAVHYLESEVRLSRVTFHRFGDCWAEVLEGEGYRFHRPCPPLEGASEMVVADLEEIEARPRGAKEPRLKDAIHTLKQYLAGRERVAVYQWPARQRSRRQVQCWNCGAFGHIARDCDEGYERFGDDSTDDLED